MSEDKKKLVSKDIVNRLAQKGYTKRTADIILKDVVAVLVEAFVAQENVKINGLGSFEIRNIAARESVHPSTQDRIIIPEHTTVKFIPGKKLKSEIADGYIMD